MTRIVLTCAECRLQVATGGRNRCKLEALAEHHQRAQPGHVTHIKPLSHAQ